MTRQRKVLVLGGGCSGVAAALALTATPALRERNAVTVVERSWRLGGKGATGRDPTRGWRIEEHGLHVWMGFYERAFGAVRRVLEELGPDASPRCRTFDDAFSPRHTFSVWSTDAQRPWSVRLPTRPGRPGDAGPLAPWRPGQVLRLATSLAASVPRTVQGARLAATLVSLAKVVGTGLLRDLPAGGWSTVDRYDLRDWLARHGASAAACQAPILRAFYDMTFAYPDGRSGSNAGAVAAGAALRSIARILFSYRGAPFWLLRHGMGDTAFAPAYDVLRRRGVGFVWMHEVQRLRTDRSGGRLETRELQGHVVPEHDPLVLHAGLRVWPNAPRVAIGPRGGATLRVERDFDDVIVAIPGPALRGALRPLAQRHPHIRAALNQMASVGTAAAQVWLKQGPQTTGITTGFRSGMPTFADLSEVLRSEDWQSEGPPTRLFYLVDTTPTDDPLDIDGAIDRWASAAGLGPGVVQHRYTRLNVEPTERYVLTLPGTVDARLEPADARIGNLRFAGDWTATSINGGSVEAAFESGERAAASL